MKKFELFPTTVIEFDFTNHPEIPLLLNYIEQSNSHSHTLIKNGTSSYATDNVLFNPKFIDLKNDIQKRIDFYSRELNILPSIISKSWFNLMNTKGLTGVHHHGSSVISGAFYPLLEENTCNLCFKSPIYSSLNFESLTPSPNNHSNHFQKDVVINIKQISY